MSGHTVPGWKTANLVEVVAHDQVNQFEGTNRAVGIPSVCQSLLEGHPAKFGGIFVDPETEVQSGRAMTTLLNGAVWCGEASPMVRFRVCEKDARPGPTSDGGTLPTSKESTLC